MPHAEGLAWALAGHRWRGSSWRRLALKIYALAIDFAHRLGALIGQEGRGKLAAAARIQWIDGCESFLISQILGLLPLAWIAETVVDK
jgi:hypothetical protein